MRTARSRLGASIRLTLAVAPVLAGALLMLAAVPVSADGGPHVADANSGVSTLTADSCAGCHRAHTAQDEYLLRASADGLCLNCHGSAGAGATTDVMLGIQFRAAGPVGSDPQDPSSVTAVAGALRGGGFTSARIGSGSDADAADRPTRISYPRWNGITHQIDTRFSALVPVLDAGLPATSAHLDLDGPGGVTATSTAWGNGAPGTASAGPVVELGCAVCHNPHGNGRYRILNPIPAPASETGGFTTVVAPVDVTDVPAPPAGETRNYTVIDTPYVSGVGTDPAAGDYWRSYRPWDGVPTYDPSDPTADSHGIVPATGLFGDQPPGTTGATWRGQITAWCAACHTRYPAPRSAATTPSIDAIYRYRHQTNESECTICHVAHGSNAVMDGPVAGSFPYPAVAGDPVVTGPSSRLLKIDNRGTCQICHDPTDTIGFGGVISNP